jgi:hypothetical protein
VCGLVEILETREVSTRDGEKWRISDSVANRKRGHAIFGYGPKEPPSGFLSNFMNVSKKRKADAHEGERVKRSRGPDGARPVQPEKSSARDKGHIAPVSKPGPSLINGDGNSGGSGESRAKEKRKSTDIDADQLGVDKGRPAKPKHKIKKLVPPRPFPTVPTSVSATGPRSAHKEGKNYICLTRKTPLGAYLRRCKDVILKDGCATLRSVLFMSNCIYTDIKLCI